MRSGGSIAWRRGRCSSDLGSDLGGPDWLQRTKDMLANVRTSFAPICLRAILYDVEHPPIVCPNGTIAFACAPAYLLDIVDVEPSPAVRDQSGDLQGAGHRRDAGAPDTHHAREELLRQQKIGTDEVVHARQPF